ncbi:hypothetical protein Pfo_016022 [Paulownia fortunei]|nr:hypothetical protein Pfo_016022 [Paulownia fortunei]
MAGALLSAPSSSSSFSGAATISDDSFEDACSICLEPFSSLDPPTVTKCKHDYHLQCILEWFKRSNKCPICSQHLVLKDPASQELLAGSESDKNLRLKNNFYPDNQDNEVGNDAPQADDSDFEQRVMRQFAAVFSKAHSISRRRRQMTPAVGPSQILSSVPATNMPNVTQINSSTEEHQNPASRSSDSDSATSARAPTVTQPASSIMFPSFELAPSHAAENSQSLPDNPGISSSSELVAFSESLKSKISTASAKYKESLSKNTRGLKEKLVARNDSVKELSRGVQREMTAGIAGIARMIERLDIIPKRGGVSVSSSSCTVGNSNLPHEVKGVEDNTIFPLLNQNTIETVRGMNPAPTPVISSSTLGGVEVSPRIVKLQKTLHE